MHFKKSLDMFNQVYLGVIFIERFIYFYVLMINPEKKSGRGFCSEVFHRE
jgi:hypothetical protein